MDKAEIQRKVFAFAGWLLLISVLSLIAVLPIVFQEVSRDGLNTSTAILTSVGAALHLLVFLAFIYGIRLSRRKRQINMDVNLAAAVVMGFFGIVVLDGAFAYADSLPYVSIGMFLCAFCDFSVVLVTVTALFILRNKEKSQ